MRTKVILFGLGQMGQLIARLAFKKEWIEIVGAVDIASQLVGKDLGDLLGLGRKTGVTITDDPDTLFSKVKADIVIHATVSDLPKASDQLEKIIKAGMHVVSTCEELAYPFVGYPELSRRLDELARQHKVSVLGTGINPGYLMDTLPIALTAVCQVVKKVKVTRMMDSGKRRISYQKKIGTGLTVEEFRRMVDSKSITGHVGLLQSIFMIASALGWKLNDIRELPPEPVVAERELRTTYTTVKPGHVAGLRSSAYGVINGERVIELNFESHGGVGEEFDSVEIEGVPNVREVINRGVNGDIGTAAILINSIPKVLKAAPGLITMLDIPIPHATP